jgi:GTP-binding protein YchF
MKIGIVGLPNVGKSTLFNAIVANAKVAASNFPFCTIEPNIGIALVPDKRLDELAKIYNPEKVTSTSIKFFDIAGLVKGASKGEGLGNKFLSNIRQCDAIIHLVRCFEDQNTIHIEGKVNPKSDIETVEMELIFSDIQILNKKIDQTRKAIKIDLSQKKSLLFLENLKNFLDEGKSARFFKINKDEKKYLKELNLLTLKPMVVVANMSEKDFAEGLGSNFHYKALLEMMDAVKITVLPICAQLEMQISDLSLEDKKIFLSDLKLDEPGLDRLVHVCYRLLGLISFLTTGKDEVRAWTIKNGSKAPEAAGKIHTDMQKGFIKAEVISFDNLLNSGSITAAKKKGQLHVEGKDYIVKDGDVILFRFNV